MCAQGVRTVVIRIAVRDLEVHLLYQRINGAVDVGTLSLEQAARKRHAEPVAASATISRSSPYPRSAGPFERCTHRAKCSRWTTSSALVKASW